MKNYSLDSIDSKFCSKTKKDTLDCVELCKICNLIPLPCYRSNKNPENIFCKTCYFSSNKKIEDLVVPSNGDLKLVGKLVFSCSNFNEGCLEEFTLNSSEELLIHQQICNHKLNIIPSNKYKNFPRNSKNVNDSLNIYKLSTYVKNNKKLFP